MKKYLVEDPWKIIESGFDPTNSEVSESIFSVGNGFMGVRGNFEEGYGGDTLPGSYFAGIYYPDKTRVGWWKNGYPEYFAKVLNGVHWIECKIMAGAEALDLSKSKISDFERTLNMQSGMLTRSFIWHTATGDLHIQFERFCSFSEKNLGAVQIKISSQNYHGPVTLKSGLDYDVWNQDTNYDEQFWEDFASLDSEHGVTISARTRKTGFEVAASTAVLVSASDWKTLTQQEERYVGFEINGSLSSGQEVVFQKLVAVESSLYVDAGKCRTATQHYIQEWIRDGYKVLRKKHVDKWAEKWQDVDIEIAGDIAAQQGIRFNIFHLLQTYRGDDPRLNIGPKGFTGEKYGGSTYWDTEAYCLPFYYHSCGPQVAQQLLMYRYRHLQKAIENAEKLGFKKGAALYPMVTMNGEECHNEWEITFEEIHRNGAMLQAINFYLQATGDYTYVQKNGLPVMIAVSRFWDQRMNYSEDKKQFVILGVTGPNEYENNVNNNWYTNFICKWCLKFTTTQLESFKSEHPQEYLDLIKSLQLTEKEIKNWNEKAENIYFPYDEQRSVFLQQDGFLDKELRPASSIPKEEYPIHKNWSWDRILRSCFIKQADVLQGLYFFEDQFDKETITRNFEFYEPLTVHESSLSPCVHGILAASIGKIEKSYEMYLRTARLDLDNYNHDTEDGLHITSMAGTWLSFVYGFAGVRIKDQILVLNPVIPDQWNQYSFKIIHQKSVVTVEVNNEIVSVTNNSEHPVNIKLYNKAHKLGKEKRVESALNLPVTSDG